MSSGYTIVNTGNTIYSGFTFTNYLGYTHDILLPPGVTYYLAGSGVTSPSVDLVLTNLGALDGYLNWEDCCSGNTMSVAVVTGSTLSPSGVFTNLGYAGFKTGVGETYGCWKTQSISVSALFSEYTIYASGSTYTDCTDCTNNNQCDIEFCCLDLTIDCNSGATGSSTTYLTYEGVVNGRQWYSFQNYSGDTLILYWDGVSDWSIDNIVTQTSRGTGTLTSNYCPTFPNTLIDNSGIMCSSGLTHYIESVLADCGGCPSNFCISDTGNPLIDDVYNYNGTHNGFPYWSGSSNGYVIYYTTESNWCLSDVLDGNCILFGALPCSSTCPDLCDSYVVSGACPTPTPTPTVNCSVLDFSAIFDCEVTPTPSVTPTISLSATNTPTPTPTEPCGGRAIDATITGYTPTPTATLTPTPTLTPEVTRPCAISGTVTYNTIDSTLVFPMSKQFQDCLNGVMYYTTSEVPLPSGGTIAVNNIFKADINGVSRCISFVGMNLSIMGIDIIELISGPLASCIVCTPDVTQTPTPTPTPSFTPTNTPTPTPSVMNGYYVYKQCGIEKYIVQSIPGPTLNVGEVFINPSSLNFNNCWEYIGFYLFEPTLPLGSLITNYSGNLFPEYGFNYFNSCNECLPTIQ